MQRVLLNWFRRQRRQIVFSVVFISIYELWRFAALDVDDESHTQREQEPAEERSVTKPRRFRDFLLFEEDEDLQLNTKLEQHHPKPKVRAVPSTVLRPPSTIAPWQPPTVDQNADIVVNASGPVVNPHPFNYIINCPELCRGVSVFLLNYVHTAVDHFVQRARIRKTWALQSHYQNFNVRTVFVVGITDNAAWPQIALEYEAALYNDIVQEDFLDTYRNLTYKGVAALKWIATYCSHAVYVMKCDDDVFVNMFALLKHLNDLYVHNFRRRLIICLVWWRMHVLRQGKWGIPKEELPDDLYPVYCSGMGFVLTTDVAVAMYHVSFYVQFRWVDDAYITGFLPRALQGSVKHFDMGRAYCGAAEMAVYWYDSEWYKYIFTHVHDEQLYRSTWDKLLDIASRNAIPTATVVRPGVLADHYIPRRTLFPELEKKRQQKALRRKKMLDEKNEKTNEQRKAPRATSTKIL